VTRSLTLPLTGQPPSGEAVPTPAGPIFGHPARLPGGSCKQSLIQFRCTFVGHPLKQRHIRLVTSPLGALDLTGPPAFLGPPSLPEPGLKWGTW